jgi:galactokinase
MAADLDSLVREHQKSFGGRVRLFRAPGRVNLIGEHTDYMDGLCLPIAVDRAAVVAAARRRDDQLAIHSTAFGPASQFSLADLGPRRTNAWHDLVRGVAAVLQRMKRRLTGASLLIDSDIPVGGGMSSSAAVAVAVGHALLALSNQRLNALELSLVVQAAENEFVGAQSGLLDPLAITSGRLGHAVLIDCRVRTTLPVVLDARGTVVVVDTRTPRDLASSGYNERRAECEAGLELMKTLVPGLESLRELDTVTLARLSDRIPDRFFRRLRHVVTENTRVRGAVGCLKRHDLRAFGRLMFDSHRSLAEDYDVTTPELDWVVAECRRCPEVYGAKMTGGGFGGCVVALVDTDAREAVADRLCREYERQFGTRADAYTVMASDGAAEVPAAGAG